MQRALLEIPTADLRGVAAGQLADGTVAATFFYDGEITSLHRELVSLTETYVVADLKADQQTQFDAVSLPTPAPLELGLLTDWVYLRWEPTSWEISEDD